MALFDPTLGIAPDNEHFVNLVDRGLENNELLKSVEDVLAWCVSRYAVLAKVSLEQLMGLLTCSYSKSLKLIGFCRFF